VLESSWKFGRVRFRDRIGSGGGELGGSLEYTDASAMACVSSAGVEGVYIEGLVLLEVESLDRMVA
jgi:hypothetical protein